MFDATIDRNSWFLSVFTLSVFVAEVNNSDSF